MRPNRRHITITAAVGMIGITLCAVPTQAANQAGDADNYRMQLVLDSSGSMKEPAKGGTKIKAAKKALDAVVDKLPDAAHVGLRVYGAKVDSGDGACTDSQQVVSPGIDNRDDLHKAVDEYKPLGETPIGYALEEAAKDLGSEGKRTIVLVSDGEPTCKPNPCKVARKLSKDGIDLRIDVVGLDVNAKTRKKLACIADVGNGTYYDADDAESLTRSIDTVSTRAFRPFDLTGKPIRGETTAADAPAIEAGTQYLDKLPVDGKQYYRVERTVPGSTLHVGTTAQTPSDSSGSGLQMQLDTPDGDLCASGTSYANGIGADRPLLSGSVNSDDPLFGCPEADVLTFSVENNENELANKPFEIVVYEEPPLSGEAKRDLPPQASQPTWSKIRPSDPEQGTVPGNSLTNAPTIEDGTYALDIQSGETQVFAVPLDWGQRLQVQIDTTMPRKAYANAGAYSGLEPVIYGPTRAKASVLTSGEEPPDWTGTPLGNLGFENDKSWRTGAMTPEVRYLNRSANDEQFRGTSIAGYRFVEVDFSVMKDGVSIPYELTVKRFGKPGEGAPDYEDTETLSAPSADDSRTSAATDDGTGDGASGESGDQEPGNNTDDSADSGDTDLASGSDSGSDVSVTALALGGVGLVVIVGGITAVALARRPR